MLNGNMFLNQDKEVLKQIHTLNFYEFRKIL